MVFSNLIFLGFFLPVVLGFYFLVYRLYGRISWLNGILLAASLFFLRLGGAVVDLRHAADSHAGLLEWTAHRPLSGPVAGKGGAVGIDSV